MTGEKLSNRYELLREIGRGGMGVVYLAYDPLLEREVAIKIVTRASLSPEAEERFKREARIIARMDHPSIVGVYDVGEHEDSLFYVMPFLRGNNLRSFIQDRSLRLIDVVATGIQVADSLEYSHTQGVIHRDVKPENIMVVREESGEFRIRITDFGLAVASSESRLTQSGTMVGTVAYFSPEQISGAELTGRSDIYSLGTVLYECLAGECPFEGEIQHVVYRILHEDPIPPGARGRSVDSELEDAVMHCLEKDPLRRPARARDVAEALQRYRNRLSQEEQQRPVFSSVESVSVRRIPATPFVGRKDEFTEVQHRLNEAQNGECQFAVVAGEAGIGKSRFLEELEMLVRARRLRVLHGRFIEQDRSFPYQGFCEVIQESFGTKFSSTSAPSGDFADLLPELVTLFPVLSELSDLKASASSARLVPQETRGSEDRTYIFELIARTLIRIGRGKPLVIFLEDLHSAQISVEALQYIVRRLGATPTLLVATYRTTEVDKSHPITRMLSGFQGDRRFLLVPLGPLDEQEHRTFLEMVLGSSKLEDRLAEILYSATEGNPFFTKELVRSLLDSGAVVRDSGGYWNFSGEAGIATDSLPATIQKTVEARIERLPEKVREILTVASVLGKTFEFRDLEMLADQKDPDAAVEDLISSGFLEEVRGSKGDRLAFSSGVVRDVLYSQMSRRKRKSMHRRYAEELERRNAGRLERVYPQLVHHFTEGDVSEKIIEYGLKVARKALQTFSAEEATRACRAVLECMEEEGAAVDLQIEAEARCLLAAACKISGIVDVALKELERAVRIYQSLGSDALMIEAMILAAETAWAGRKVEETARWVGKGLELAQDSAVRSRLLSLGATVANLRGEQEQAKEYLQELERLRPALKDASEEDLKGGTLVVALSSAVHANHPAAAHLDEEEEILSNVFETLITIGSNGSLLPLLCEQWQQREGGRSFLIKLRTDVKSPSGRPLTASEVRSAFEAAIRFSKEEMPQAYVSMQGILPYLEGTAEHVSGLEIVSDEELLIHLREALPIYPAFLADPGAAVAFESDGKFEGTGPFQLTEFSSNRAVLKSNPAYWKGTPPSLDSLEFRLSLTAGEIASGFRSGEFDLVRDLRLQDLEDVLRDRRLRARLVEAPRKNVYFVLFNSASKICSIPGVRKALCGIIRTQDLVRKTLGRLAQPAEGLIPPGIIGHDPGRRRAPMLREKVVQLLEASHLTPPLRLHASVHPTLQDRYASLTKTLLKVWSEIGVELVIETPNMAAYLESLRKNDGIDLVIGRYNADFDDPDNFTYGFFHSRMGHYRQYFCSGGMDLLMEEARMEPAPAVREKLYRKIEGLLIETGYVLPLFHDIEYRLASPRIKKLALSSTPPYVNYAIAGKSPESGIFPRKKEGGTIHVPVAGEVQSLDPSLVFLVVQMEVIPTIFETLTRETEGARVMPWLASEYTAEEGSRRFRFRLRDNIRFHDGKKMTARDVRYSFERLLQNHDSASRWPLTSVRGAQKVLNGETRELEGFQIQSAFEFTIDLDQPVSFFPTLMAFPSTGIVPEGTETLSGNWREQCIGTGPFRVARFEPYVKLELEANPHYWRQGYPRSDALIFYFNVSPQEILKGFRNGTYSLAWDIFPSEVEALRRAQDFRAQYAETPRLSTYYVVFNIHNGPLADETLRHQLVQSVDVEGLVRRHLGALAIPAYGLIPPGLLGHVPGRRSTTPRVLRPSAITGVELSAIINSVYEGPYSAVADELMNSFREKGFVVNNVGDTKSEYYRALASATADIVVTRWIADYPDPDTFVHGLLHSEKGIIGRVCGLPEMDELIEQGRSETDPHSRQQIYRQIEDTISRNALLLPLFHEQAYCFAQPEVEEFEVTFSRTIVPYEKLSHRKSR